MKIYLGIQCRIPYGVCNRRVRERQRDREKRDGERRRNGEEMVDDRIGGGDNGDRKGIDKAVRMGQGRSAEGVW